MSVQSREKKMSSSLDDSTTKNWIAGAVRPENPKYKRH